MIFETPQRSNVSSNLLRGDDTIHKQRQKTTSFLDAHTTFKLHWPLTRPISKANIASFTGPLPGQSQKPILPASLAPYQANLKSQYCQIHLAVHCWSLLHQLNPIFQEGQYILGGWNVWSQPFVLLLCDLCC